MIYKVYYQDSKLQIPTRENTKSLYIDSDSEKSVRKLLKDKNYGYAIKKLMPIAHHVVATEPLSERSLSAGEMAEAVRPYCSSAVAEPDIAKAIEKAVGLYGKDSMICVCGSLYLAGSAYEYIISR